VIAWRGGGLVLVGNGKADDGAVAPLTPSDCMARSHCGGTPQCAYKYKPAGMFVQINKNHLLNHILSAPFYHIPWPQGHPTNMRNSQVNSVIAQSLRRAY
jgi:hypothetical protein